MIIPRNNTSYQSFINNTFASFKIKKSKEDLSDFCEKQESGTPVLASYQIFPSKLINDDNNNRGILLYYKTGAGKTGTFINIAEGMKRKTIVVSPASLRPNFVDELMKWRPDKYKSMSDIYKKYSFVAFDAPNIMSQYDRIVLFDLAETTTEMNRMFKRMNKNRFDNALVIIDECHEFFQHVVSQSEQCEKLLNRMYSAKNCKFVFATATPIVKNPFELVPMFNILAGFELFPSDVLEFNKLFVDKKRNRIKNQSVFMDRINGMVCYYAGLKDKNRDVIPEDHPIEVIEIPMSDYQFSKYLEKRLKEWDDERRAKFATAEFEKRKYKLEYRKGAMTYKVKSRELCNFALPESVNEKIQEIFGPGTSIDMDANLAKQKVINEYLTDEDIRENLSKYSPKFEAIINFIESIRRGPGNIVVYSDRINAGCYLFARCLEAKLGFVHVSPENIGNEKYDGMRYAIIDGRVSPKMRNELKQIYNQRENSDGRIVKILIGSSVIQRGISFFSSNYMIIMNAQWKYADIMQAKGRINRICSHKFIKDKANRFTKTYIYLSSISEHVKSEVGSDKGMSSDQLVHDKAIKSQVLIDSFARSIEMAAIDCELNRENNEINCRTCKPTDEKLYEENDDPNLLIRHIITGSKCEPIDNSYITLYPIAIEGNDGEYKIDLDWNIYQKEENQFVQIGHIDPMTSEIKIST